MVCIDPANPAGFLMEHRALWQVVFLDEKKNRVGQLGVRRICGSWARGASRRFVCQRPKICNLTRRRRGQTEVGSWSRQTALGIGQEWGVQESRTELWLKIKIDSDLRNPSCWFVCEAFVLSLFCVMPIWACVKRRRP